MLPWVVSLIEMWRCAQSIMAVPSPGWSVPCSMVGRRLHCIATNEDVVQPGLGGAMPWRSGRGDGELAWRSSKILIITFMVLKHCKVANLQSDTSLSQRKGRTWMITKISEITGSSTTVITTRSVVRRSTAGFCCGYVQKSRHAHARHHHTYTKLALQLCTHSPLRRARFLPHVSPIMLGQLWRPLTLLKLVGCLCFDSLSKKFSI